MTPEMSTLEMLDSFILIVKGSRIIDRNELDWGDAYWQNDNHVRGLVYTVGELKRYFAHRVFKSKYKSDCADPFNDWLLHRFKLTAPTLRDAMRLAYNVSEGLMKKPSVIQFETLKAEAEAKLASAIAGNWDKWVIESLQCELKRLS